MVELTNMTNAEMQKRASELIAKKYLVHSDYAERLAKAALEGIDSHGGDPRDWETVVATVDVVVKSWIEIGALKDESA